MIPLDVQLFTDTVDPEQLAAHAYSHDRHIRLSVAAHSATPPDVLAALSDDTDWSVERAVAGNRSTPEPVLRAMFTRNHYYFAHELATNPSCPPDILHELADYDVPVRLALTHNPSTAPHTLATLAADSHSRVQLDALLNPKAPGEALRKALGRPSLVDDVAAHMTDAQLRDAFIHADSPPRVRKAAGNELAHRQGVTVITEYQQHDNPRVRAACTALLATWLT